MGRKDTRIPLESDTRDELRALKTGVETYDDVLRRLMRDHKDNA